jgi:hypothetical protein
MSPDFCSKLRGSSRAPGGGGKGNGAQPQPVAVAGPMRASGSCARLSPPAVALRESAGTRPSASPGQLKLASLTVANSFRLALYVRDDRFEFVVAAPLWSIDVLSRFLSVQDGLNPQPVRDDVEHPTGLCALAWRARH